MFSVEEEKPVEAFIVPGLTYNLRATYNRSQFNNKEALFGPVCGFAGTVRKGAPPMKAMPPKVSWLQRMTNHPHDISYCNIKD